MRPHPYCAAFTGMLSEPHNLPIVGEADTGRLLAFYQFTFISGLWLHVTRRARVEGVRVASSARGFRGAYSG
ncbi:MAG: hypothetical protein AAF922_08285 [Pseudomonadota bacterium]